MKEGIDGDKTDTTSELKVSELKAITQDVRYLLVAVSALRQDFNTKIQTDDSKEQLIMKLNEELQLYHNDSYIPALKSILIDLITLYDDLNIIVENIHATIPETPDPVLQMLISFQVSITRILQRNEVNPFVLEQDVFHPVRQRALCTIATNDMRKDHHIARRVCMGFEYGNRTLRPELVNIYKYVAPIAQEEQVINRRGFIHEQ